MSPSTSYSPSSSSRPPFASTATASGWPPSTGKATIATQASSNSHSASIPVSSGPIDTTNYLDGLFSGNNCQGGNNYHGCNNVLGGNNEFGGNNYLTDSSSNSSSPPRLIPAVNCSSMSTSSSGTNPRVTPKACRSKTPCTSNSRSLTRVAALSYTLSVNRLPSDVLFEIARWLSPMDRVNSVRVCKRWFDAMRPFLWESVGHRQWQNLRFPLYDHNNPRNKIPLPNLGWIKEVIWSPGDSSIAGLKNEIIFEIMYSFHNLRSLSLSSAATRLPQVILAKLMDKNSFPRMKRLELDLMMPFEGRGPVPIHQMFSRFEQLDELMLGGTWFRPETPAELDLPPATKPWKLAKLKVPRQHTELLRMCPDLRQLEFSSFPFGGDPSSMANAASCANLRELRFSGGGFHVLDFGAVLPQLSVLTTLSVQMWDQVQFFHLEGLVDAAIAPGLRHLELDFLSAHLQPADQVELAAPHQERLVRILNSRGQLETFELKGIAVRADTFFSNMGGEASTPRCPCHHVKKLNLEIYKTPAMDTDPIVSQEVWSLIYTQLRAVGALRILTLVCPDIHSTVERGFEVLGKMATLAELSLVDPTRPSWLTTSVEAIVAAAPRLKSMSLRPLTDASRDLINGWLTERKKTDLRF